MFVVHLNEKLVAIRQVLCMNHQLLLKAFEEQLFFFFWKNKSQNEKKTLIKIHFTNRFDKNQTVSIYRMKNNHAILLHVVKEL